MAARRGAGQTDTETSTSGSDASSSSDDIESRLFKSVDDEKPKRMHLQEDIFGHVVITYLRHGSNLDDKVRAILLMALVLAGQLLVASALTIHCMNAIWGVEEDMYLAVKNGFDSVDVEGTGAIMQRVCGLYTADTEPIADGFGSAFHQRREFNFFGKPTSRLEQLHYQLRAEFQLVFACVAVFWTWRCFSELRMCWGETLAFLLYKHVAEPGEFGSSADYRSEDGSSVEASQSVGRRIRRRDQCFVVIIMSLRFMVAALLLVSGYLLICMSDRIIDLVLNAVALEFIFDVDDMIVMAMLAKKEYRLLSMWEFSSPVGLLKTVQQQCGIVRTKRRNRNCAGWRCRDWLRLVSLLVIVFLLVWPHNLKIRALHSRARAVCLTSGLTDGTNRFPGDVPGDFVIYPVRGFCRTFVNSFIEEIWEPVCGAWRLGIQDRYSLAMCTNPLDIESAHFYHMDAREREVRQVCLSMWFGMGVPLGAPVPALARQGEPEPEMFGCRAADLRVRTRSVWWYFFRDHVAQIVSMECTRPAFGPDSAVWNATPLDSADQLAAPNFFQNDPRSPIEHQVGACDKLAGVQYCNGDPCLIVAEERGHSCDEVCREQALLCIEAFATGGVCPKDGSSRRPCAERSRDTDPVCRCGLPPAARRCGLLPHARARCGDPCRVLVSPLDFATGRPTGYRDCDAYCRTANLTCLAQQTVVSHSCKVSGTSSCSTALPELHTAAPMANPSAVAVRVDSGLFGALWGTHAKGGRSNVSKDLDAMVQDAQTHHVCVCEGAAVM